MTDTSKTDDAIARARARVEARRKELSEATGRWARGEAKHALRAAEAYLAGIDGSAPPKTAAELESERLGEVVDRMQDLVDHSTDSEALWALAQVVEDGLGSRVTALAGELQADVARLKTMSRRWALAHALRQVALDAGMAPSAEVLFAAADAIAGAASEAFAPSWRLRLAMAALTIVGIPQPTAEQAAKIVRACR